MKLGEYLTDYAARFEMERQVQPAPQSEEAIHALEERTAALGIGWGLYLSGFEGRLFYPISDLDDREERAFLYWVGRTAYDLDVTAEIFPAEFLKEKMGLPSADRDRVMTLLEEEENALLFDRGYPRGV